MHLKQLTLGNYRCFESLQIDFHPELTVLIAPNGSGKTTVLDAARVALWPYVKGFDLGSQAGKSATIQIADVRLAPQADGNMEPQLPSRIEAVGSWETESTERTWEQRRERVKPGTNTLGDAGAKQLTAFASQLEQQVRSASGTVTLPLVSYLGTSRLWFEGRFTSTAEDVVLDTSDYSRSSGYLNCLAYASSFKAFTAWYGWIFRSYREEQIRAVEQGRPLDETGQRFATVIAVITRAVDTLVSETTGWHGLEYKASQQQQRVMHHAQFGSMPVDMLSDGVRNAIAMVADLAYRAYKLNPHLGADAALGTPGVALIDEVEKAEREREAVPKDFKLMAQKREMKASGWGDRGDQWQAAPDGLKKLIEGYNAAPKEARPAILDRILSDSSRREQVHGLIAEQRAQHRENGRGLSR